MSATPGSGGGGTPPDDTLSLIANGQSITGWQTVRLTRGAERMPADFEIGFTERYPTETNDIVVKPGDPCVVQLGADVVLTGYVDRYSARIAPDQHDVRISGRSKCEDLVDCSAVVVGMQVFGSSTLALAQHLAAPYGITVSSLSGNGPGIPRLNVTLGQTPFEIIEQVARYSALLAYDGTDGNLILAQAGASQMASGFQIGVNLQAASVEFSMDGRFSQYIPAIMSVDSLSDLGSGNFPFPIVYDKGVPRFRQQFVVSEQYQNGNSIAQARAQWEMMRNYGRSQAVRITCDSWRDSAGTLWAPNALATVNIPQLKIVAQSWVIAEVTFRRDGETGTTADLILMPKEAFLPEPSVLQLYDWQIGQALQGTQGGGGAARHDG